MRRRRAFTLVEMLIAISLGSSLLLLATQMIHQTMNVSRTNQDRADVALSESRFARQFRRDVHQAISFDLLDEGHLILSLSDNRECSYAFRAGNVERRLLQEGELLQVEAFNLGEGGVVTIEELSTPKRLSAKLVRVSGIRHLDPLLNRKVEAVVGKMLLSSVVEEPE